MVSTPMSSTSKSKRYFVSVPIGIAKCLDYWAEKEGGTPTGLASFLIEAAVRKAIDEGKIPQPWELDETVPKDD